MLLPRSDGILAPWLPEASMFQGGSLICPPILAADPRGTRRGPSSIILRSRVPPSRAGSASSHRTPPFHSIHSSHSVHLVFLSLLPFPPASSHPNLAAAASRRAKKRIECAVSFASPKDDRNAVFVAFQDQLYSSAIGRHCHDGQAMVAFCTG